MKIGRMLLVVIRELERGIARLGCRIGRDRLGFFGVEGVLVCGSGRMLLGGFVERSGNVCWRRSIGRGNIDM